MPKQPTTIRLDADLHHDVLHAAQKAGLSFTNIVHILLYAYVEGTVQIGVTQYPKGYLNALGREAKELRQLHKRGKAKRYNSSQKLFDDILER